MPGDRLLPLWVAMAACGAAGAVGLVGARTVAIWRSLGKKKPGESETTPRSKLPSDIETWRALSQTYEEDDAKWIPLKKFLLTRGYILWSRKAFSSMHPPAGAETMANGFAYATFQRGLGEFYNYDRWEYSNPLCRAARTMRGQDVIIRVTSVGEEGQDHLAVLRKVARGEMSLFSDNHVLPLLDEIVLGDITLCVFPRAGLTLDEAHGGWARNSAGDVIDMIMQALEGLAFLHNQRIAHQDAFKSNFMVEWMPESLRSADFQVSRPRVYIIDLETAVEFPEECAPHECRCTTLKLPLGGTPEKYARPVPPEITDGQPFDPFKLDIWQLGTSFSSFKSTIAAIDKVLVSLAHPDASSRPSTSEALSSLAECVNAMPPKALRIEPDFPPLPFDIDDT